MAEAEIKSQAPNIEAIETPSNPLSRLIRAEMPDGAIVRKNKCKLCNSPFRDDAERMYEEGKPHADIKKFLDGKGEVFTIWAIMNHLKAHYQDASRLVRLSEYMDNLAAIRDRRQSRRQMIETTIDIGLVELGRILPMQTNNDMLKEDKREDMILRIINSIREGEKMLMGMENAEEEIKAIQQKFVAVWKAKIESAKDDAEREIFIGMFKDFRRMLQSSEGQT